MVSRGDHIDVLMAENLREINTFRLGGVIKTIAFDAIARIYNQQILSLGFYLFPHALREGDVVTPVRRVGWPATTSVGELTAEDLRWSLLLQMTGQPAMGIGCMEEIQLPELEVSQRRGDGRRRGGLSGERRREEEGQRR